MSLPTSTVDLDSIHVDPNSRPFDPASKKTEIEALAHTITQLKALLRLPLVRSTGIDEYELVEGHLEYAAYLRAREIDSSLPDRLTVFILKPSNEEAILKQLEVSQTVDRIAAQTTAAPAKEIQPSSNDALSLRIGSLESAVKNTSEHLTSSINAFNEEVAKLKAEMVAAIDSKLPQPLPPLEAFNQLADDSVRELVRSKLEFLGKKKAAKIVEMLLAYQKKHKGEKFKQFNDILNALEKGTLSAAKMLEVIDQWNN